MSYSSIAALDGGKGTIASNYQWTAQSGQVYGISGLKRDKRLENLIYWDVS